MEGKENKASTKISSENQKHLDEITENFKRKLYTFRKNEINKKGFTTEKLKIMFYLFFILIFTTYLNLFRPLIIILNIIFSLSGIGSYSDNEKTADMLLIIGIILIIILPFIAFFKYLFKILSLVDKLGKLFYMIFLLIETIFELPLTFLYKSNSHSVYLVEQEGKEQIINPSLIFYPTEYVISFINLFKNFFVSGFYIFLASYAKDSSKQISKNAEFLNVFKSCIVAFNLINIIGVFCILVFKCLKKKYSKEIIKSENKIQPNKNNENAVSSDNKNSDFENNQSEKDDFNNKID